MPWHLRITCYVIAGLIAHTYLGIFGLFVASLLIVYCEARLLPPGRAYGIDDPHAQDPACALFGVLGFIAGTSGRVTATHIAVAESISASWSKERRLAAFRAFRRGRRAVSLRAPIRAVLRLASPGSTLCHQVVSTSAAIAYAEGPPGRDTLAAMECLAERLRVAYRPQTVSARPPPRALPLNDTMQDAAALRLLGVTRPASPAEIKRAYRRKLSQCHPDKLGANASPWALQRANEQTQRLREAYRSALVNTTE